MSDFIGPALPPGLKTCSESDEGELIGPALPITKEVDSGETLGIGPQPPPGFSCKTTTTSDLGADLRDEDQNKDQRTMYGPPLPPEFTIEGARSYGPTLPPGFNPESSRSEGDGMTDLYYILVSQSSHRQVAITI